MTHAAMAKWATAKRHLGLTDRPAQEELFAGVVEALDAGGDPVFAQAPCGGGKSLLVAPLSAFADVDGRVIHSSYTKSQQAQMARDGKALVDAGLFTTVAEVRGRSEYVCEKRWGKAAGRLGLPAPTVTGVGLRGQVSPALSDAEWAAVRSDSESGCGSGCGSADWANRARAHAMTAGALVVVNHSVLALDVLLGGALIGLGENDALVLDEAHQAPDAFRSALGARVSAGRLRRLARLVETDLLLSPGDQGPVALDGLLGSLTKAPAGDYESFAFLAPGALDGPLWDAAAIWVARVAAMAAEAASGYASRRDKEGMQRAAGVERVAKRLSGDMGDAVRALTDEGRVVWVDRQRPALEVRALDVTEFSRRVMGTANVAVATSATVAGYPMDELGGGRLIEVGSPFDLESQRIAVMTTNRDTRDEGRRLDDLRALVAKRTGGVLVLAPTNKVQVGGRWRSTADLCVETLSAAGYRVGQQKSPADVPMLTAGLMDRRLDVVVATASMREGVDLPGDALSMVILYGLPWPYMGDPMLQARIRKLGDRKWDLLRPMMEVNLEQAIGRLIRTSEDSGVVALLDGRPNAVRTFRAKVRPSPEKWLGL